MGDGTSRWMKNRGRRSVWGRDIRRARIAVELTQDQLGRRLGFVPGGQTVNRWELNHSQPSERQRALLCSIIHTLNPEAAVKLAAAFATKPAEGGSPPVALPTAPSASTAPETEVRDSLQERESSSAEREAAIGALELALLRMADDLDVPARRVRVALPPFLRALGSTKLSLAEVDATISEWIAGTG